MASSKSNSNPKAGVIGFLIPSVGISALFGFAPAAIAVGCVLGLVSGKILSIMGSGLDTTTHNKQDVLRQKQLSAKQIPLTGNETADMVITEGQKMLSILETSNAAIPDTQLSDMMDQLSERVCQVLQTVSADPGKASQIRKFTNYYLPTAGKLLTNYRSMYESGVTAETLSKAKGTTLHGLDMIMTACQKQIDHLHQDDLLDISTDIDVLEQMLYRDGYSDASHAGSIEPSQEILSSRTAAEAQMRVSGAPVLDFSSIRKDSDELSSQQQTSV